MRWRTSITATSRVSSARRSIETLRREITAAWETEEVRRERPSPLDEVRSALAVFEETLWDALPLYCRSLDRTLRQSTGRGLPLDAAPIRFGSWIGGDRDGNPFVTPEVTRSACLMARWTGLSLYAKEIEQLRFELSMSDATPELLAQVDGCPRAVPRAAAIAAAARRCVSPATSRSSCGRRPLAAGRSRRSSMPAGPASRGSRRCSSRCRSSWSRSCSAIARCTPPATASSPTAG